MRTTCLISRQVGGRVRPPTAGQGNVRRGTGWKEYTFMEKRRRMIEEKGERAVEEGRERTRLKEGRRG